MYNSQGDPSFMISNLDEILYISSHTRKWSKSACPLDILEPNSFTCGEFNIKYSWQRSRQLDHNTTHRVVFPRGPEWITRLKSHPYNHKIESHSLPSTDCHLPLQRGIPTMQVKNQDGMHVVSLVVLVQMLTIYSLNLSSECFLMKHIINR